MDTEEQKWYDTADAMDAGLGDYLERKILSENDIYEFVRSACKSILEQKRFQNSFQGKEPESLLESFYEFIRLAMSNENTLAMVPLQMSLYKSGQLTLREFINYLRDTVLLTKGYDIPAAGEEGDEYLNLEDDFNAWLDKAEDAASADNYETAIEALDKAFLLAAKEPMLFYDRCTMYNNRAYYNFRLGNLEEALKDCEIAIEDQEQGLFYHTKAEILLEMKRYADALEAINKAVALEPSSDKKEFREIIRKAMSS
jgi:tetratricopeptide (TPR) repeat protein